MLPLRASALYKPADENHPLAKVFQRLKHFPSSMSGRCLWPTIRADENRSRRTGSPTARGRGRGFGPLAAKCQGFHPRQSHADAQSAKKRPPCEFVVHDFCSWIGSRPASANAVPLILLDRRLRRPLTLLIHWHFASADPPELGADDDCLDRSLKSIIIGFESGLHFF